MRTVSLVLASLLAAGTSAFAQAQDFRGTVNEVTPQQEARGRAAVAHAGYQPTELQFAQDGNLFFTVVKNGVENTATVTRAGKVYVSSGGPAPSGGS